GFWREGSPEPTAAQMLNADLEIIGGDYFSALKVPLLRGRVFDERDTKNSPRVVIIDQAMVDQYFPNEDPIGKRIAVDAGNDEEGNVMSEIVGVVARMLSHGMQLLLVGSIIGLVSAITLSRFLQRVLFEASGADPRIYLGVAAVMFAATILACWLPARRASRVDPMVALRME